MGIKKNADASYNLGLGVSDANDYKGFAGQNEITIQLTADGATDKSMDALNYLKTFAINQAAAGLPIKPSASVSISANGYTKALEADDFEITETGVKIGGIEYTASTDSWDFTNALVPSGGGGGSSDLFPITISWNADWSLATLNKTFSEIKTALESGLFPLVTSVNENDGYYFDIYSLEQFVSDSDGCSIVITIVDASAQSLNVYYFNGMSLDSIPTYNSNA